MIAIIGNYRNVDMKLWEGLPHIFHAALHSKWILSLSHSLRPLFPTCRSMLALECLVWAPPWRPAYSKRHQVSLNNKVPSRDTLEPTCSRGYFWSAPWAFRTVAFFLGRFWAFVCHDDSNNCRFICKFYIWICTYTWSEEIQPDELWRYCWILIISFLFFMGIYVHGLLASFIPFLHA